MIEKKMNICCYCEKSGAVSICGKCQYFYCSVNCQRKDWPVHKMQCNEYKLETINRSSEMLIQYLEINPNLRMVYDFLKKRDLTINLDLISDLFKKCFYSNFRKNIKCQNIWLKCILSNSKLVICGTNSKTNIEDYYLFFIFEKLCNSLCVTRFNDIQIMYPDQYIEDFLEDFLKRGGMINFLDIAYLKSSDVTKKSQIHLGNVKNINICFDGDSVSYMINDKDVKFLSKSKANITFTREHNRMYYDYRKDKERLSVLLCGHFMDKNSELYKDNLPTDLFKLIYDYAIVQKIKPTPEEIDEKGQLFDLLIRSFIK